MDPFKKNDYQQNKSRVPSNYDKNDWETALEYIKHGMTFREASRLSGIPKSTLQDRLRRKIAMEGLSNQPQPFKGQFRYNENDLRKALDDIRTRGLSIREASRRTGVPKSTIRDRLRREIEDKTKVGSYPVLDMEEEQKISKWVSEMAKHSFPILKRHLLEAVVDLVKEDGETTPIKPAVKWYKRFLRRHKEISIHIAESKIRVKAIATEENIRNWFENLKEFLCQQGHEDILNTPDRIFNADETWFSLNPITGEIISPKGYNDDKEKENITIYVSFNASGKICPPLVVLPYLDPPEAVIGNMPSSWVLGKSEKGYMESSIFYDYIVNEFDSWLENNNIKKPCILFMDGYTSQINMRLSQFCEKNQIILYSLPPNTMHLLQPADVSIFKPLKQHWETTVLDWQRENPNSTVTKINCCQIFAEIMAKDMRIAIINGFKNCGLYPFNPDAVDYRKCFIENLPELKSTKNEQISNEGFDTTIQVISYLRNELENNGINTDIVLKIIETAKSKVVAADKQMNGSKQGSMRLQIKNYTDSEEDLSDFDEIPIEFDENQTHFGMNMEQDPLLDSEEKPTMESHLSDANEDMIIHENFQSILKDEHFS